MAHEGFPPDDDEPDLVEPEPAEVPPGRPPPPADEAQARGPSVRNLLPDTLKKALLTGVGALFMTEEGARRLARDWKLPKELIGYIGQQAQGAKEEILRVLSDEIRRFLESESLRREFWKALSSAAIEVKAEIRLVPAEGDPAAPPRPKVKATVRARRASGSARGRGRGKAKK